jgi:hypothetical protein
LHPRPLLVNDCTLSHSRIGVNDIGRKEAERAAALLNLENWYQAASLGINLVLDHAKASVNGATEIAYCTPETRAMLESNPRFIEALC